MKRIGSFIRTIIALTVLAFSIGVLHPWIPSARFTTYAAAAVPNAKAIVAFHQFNPVNGQVVLDATPTTYLDSLSVANIARYFETGGQSFVLFGNGNTGKLRVHRLINGQDIGPKVFNYERPTLRFSSAGIASSEGKLYLFLLNPFVGQIIRYTIKDDGSLDAGSGASEPIWKDMSLFSVFKQKSEWRLFAYDPWTGKVGVGDLNGQRIATDNWSIGYTSVDHLYVDDTTAYRLLYKAAGDPYKEPGEKGDDSGLLVIQKLSADGLSGGTTQSTVSVSTSADGKQSGWSNIRFIALTDSLGVPHYSVFFYNRKSGEYMQVGFNEKTGTLGFIQTAQGNIGPRWTDIDPYVYQQQGRLITVNYEDVRPFYYDEVERMGLEIHKRLATKVVGYQLMVSQSGQVIYNRGWGKKRLDLNDDELERMTTDTRLDLGSVSKMITAVTLLKLSSLGEVDLNAPISNYLDPTDYPKDSWVTKMKVNNLLTHTTGMKEGGCDKNKDDLTMDCGNFFAAKQSEDLFNEATNDYEYYYNNSNFGAARKVIEHVTGVTTSPEIVSKTYELWAEAAFDMLEANAIEFNGITCYHEPDVYYFASCHGAENCYDFQDQPWQQSHLIEGWSTSCSAGTWAGSSRNMLEFLNAIRYSRILGDSPEQKMLTDTEMTSGGEPTALSWEQPWIFGSDKYLGKNGAKGDDDSEAAFHTYITRLPDNADAVLLVNTAGVDPSNLLLSAYVFGLDPALPMPVFNSEDEFKTGDVATTIALNETDTNSIYTTGDYVTAAVTDGKLSLTLWDVHNPGDGQIERKEEVKDDLSIKDVRITDGPDFVTAVRDNSDRLRVIAWAKPFGLQRYGEAKGDEVKQISVTKACSDALRGRAVTAVRNKDDKLQLDVWEYDNSANTVKRTDTLTLGPVTLGVTIETLKYVNSLTQKARVVTAMRNANGKLQVDVFDVLSTGQLVHKDGDSFGTVTAANTKSRIAIDPRGAGSDFFKGIGFLTASINDVGNLEVITWKTDAFGNITKVKDVTSMQIATSVDVTRATTVARSDGGYLLMTKWKIDDLGNISALKADTKGAAINQVVAAGNVVTAYRDTNDKLYLVNWWQMQ
jgi:hypothetical protein